MALTQNVLQAIKKSFEYAHRDMKINLISPDTTRSSATVITLTLGLFTGMSLLSIVEVVLFLYILIQSIFQDFIETFDKPKSRSSKAVIKKDEKDVTKYCRNKEKVAHNEEQIHHLYVSKNIFLL